MYGISPDLDLSFCIGSHLERISIGKHDLVLFFESGSKIALQGEVVVLQSGKTIAKWNEEDGWSSLAFRNLLNLAVTAGRVHDEKIIELEFPEGLTLQLHDSSEQYESMQIYLADPNAPLIVI